MRAHIQQGQAAAEARGEIERLARAILRKKAQLHEFVMAMGTWFFTNHAGKVVEHEVEHYNPVSTSPYSHTPRRWVAPLWEFIQEWDEDLHLTGDPMRFTAEGPVITEW